MALFVFYKRTLEWGFVGRLYLIAKNLALLYCTYFCSDWQLLLASDASGRSLDFVAHAEHDDGYEKAENANYR